MSTQNTQNEDQEIDLGQLFGKIGGLFEKMGDTVFRMMQFVKKNVIILALLLILGIGVGMFLDSKANSYEQKIIVTPNFGTVDYLYNKVNFINSRIMEGDTVFLKSIGIEEPKSISSIKISPIVDIYNFVNEKSQSVNNAQNTQNYELVKLLAESSDISKVIKDSITSKNYSNHLITIKTNGFTTNKKSIEPILNYLNKSSFYAAIQAVYVTNIKTKIQKDEQTINQIDAILNSFSKTSDSKPNDKLIYYNENTQLNDLINNKNYLISNIGGQKAQLELYSKIIKDKSEVLNVKYTKGISNKMKLVLPILLIFGFLFFGYIRSFYKKHLEKFSQFN